MSENLLDLVRQYGDERENVGSATPERGELNRAMANAAVREAEALLTRIAALIPQQPVQVRDRDGDPVPQLAELPHADTMTRDELVEAFGPHLGDFLARECGAGVTE